MGLTHVNGSAIELKWNMKDLGNLEAVLPLVRQRHVVVQAGGCLGVFPDRLAGEFDVVYTFEPDPKLFRHLVLNTARKTNIVYFQAALGYDRRCVQTVCELRPNDGKTVLHEGMTRTEPNGLIPTMRVDDLALPACDLLYLDIEGDEIFALQGANYTIARYKPVVVCEVNRGVEYRGFQQSDVASLLTKMDYQVAARHRSDVVFLPMEVG
jgi:FkbM family methyltransferase